MGFTLKFDLPRYLLLRVEMSDQVVEAARAVEPAPSWRQIAVQDVPSEQSLRVAAQTWLKQKEILHKTLTNSSFQKKVVLIARCYECSGAQCALSVQRVKKTKGSENFCHPSVWIRRLGSHIHNSLPQLVAF